jgi:hypothetical protein
MNRATTVVHRRRRRAELYDGQRLGSYRYTLRGKRRTRAHLGKVDDDAHRTGEDEEEATGDDDDDDPRRGSTVQAS